MLTRISEIWHSIIAPGGMPTTTKGACLESGLARNEKSYGPTPHVMEIDQLKYVLFCSPTRGEHWVSYYSLCQRLIVSAMLATTYYAL